MEGEGTRRLEEGVEAGDRLVGEEAAVEIGLEAAV